MTTASETSSASATPPTSAANTTPPPPVALLNGRFDPVTLDETVELITRRIHAGQRGYLCTVNVAILMMMRKDPRLQRFVDQAAMIVADGQPLIWSSRMLSRPLPERVAGVELVERLCERAAREGFGVYLLGAHQTVVSKLAERLVQKYPGLILSGVADGYFGAEESESRARAVAASGAKILVVAMGVPKQEHFIEEYWDRLNVPFAVGVGGSFDVLAGLRARAPEIVQRVGLEWFFRLAQEPRRLWKRYLTTNAEFMYLIAREILASRTPRS
ncbi:MAG: WecB/TagA/CpsF family glycosyltransferase [Myxococcales bacterium]